MVITSVNRSIESQLLQDNGFLYSHLAPYLLPCFSSEVSGRALEASVVASDLVSYETAMQLTPIDLIAQTVDALNNFLSDPNLLTPLASMQTVLIGSELLRPVLGLPALIMLNKISQSSKPNIGNVVAILDDFTDGADYFELPTYISFTSHEFCSSLHDLGSKEDIDIDPSCLYVPLHVKTTNATNTDFNISPSSPDWLYRLIRNYTQGHYSLIKACDVATKNIDVFSLLVASILGAKQSAFIHNIQDSSFPNLERQQQLDVVASMKPLIEYISYDYSRDKIAIS